VAKRISNKKDSMQKMVRNETEVKVSGAVFVNDFFECEFLHFICHKRGRRSEIVFVAANFSEKL
jgi:hypothetical protein